MLGVNNHQSGYSLIVVVGFVLLLLVAGWYFSTISSTLSDQTTDYLNKKASEGANKNKCNFPPPDPCGTDSGSDFSSSGI